MNRALDIVLFGATGFTGKHVLPMIQKFSNAKNRTLLWGVSGRSEEKLKKLLSEWEKKIGMSLDNVPIIVADVSDEKSLREMARQTRIVINCCGPYRFFGEAVVKACVDEGTHHVDVSGEPQYMEKMQLKYNQQAKEKGVYVVSACGFDSIPSDLGVVFLKKKFNGTLNSVVTYLNFWEEGGPYSGPSVNYGTWESAVYGLAHADELRGLRKQLHSTRLPSFKPKLQLKTMPHRNNLVQGFAVPFPGSDRSVVRRSQRLFYDRDQLRPVQVETYFLLTSFWSTLMLMIFGILFKLLAGFGIGRALLLKYPSFFSCGVFSHENPSEERVENSRFCITLYGEGWSETRSNPNEEFQNPPNKAICAKVQGKNVGYGATCVCLVLSAITILTEPDKMPPEGGVYPPGYAFANTSLIDQLNENEVTFELVFEKDLSASKL